MKYCLTGFLTLWVGPPEGQPATKSLHQQSPEGLPFGQPAGDGVAVEKWAGKLKKALRETQTLHAGCSKAEPKNFAPPQTLFLGA